MNYLYLSNCLLCDAPLGDASYGHLNFYYCSKDSDHFTFDMTNNLIQVTTDYGKFQFAINGREISCAIFHDETSGQRVWLNSAIDDDNDMMVITTKPTVDNIKSIIEKFEIRRVFK